MEIILKKASDGPTAKQEERRTIETLADLLAIMDEFGYGVLLEWQWQHIPYEDMELGTPIVRYRSEKGPLVVTVADDYLD